MESMIEYIEGRHNPENDAGIVTWCDMRLLAIIEKLVKKVEALEEKVKTLEDAEQERTDKEALAFVVDLYKIQK